MKKSYKIGDLEFKTKKEVENYTRNIINELNTCIINKDHIYFIFFNNLIKNHPKYDEKIGNGIDYFYIKTNQLFKNLEMMIKRLDGSEVDFSWIQCCKFRQQTNEQYLTKAMREAISNDIITFKQSQIKLICSFCKLDNENYKNYHVDHHNPSFENIKNNFLKSTKKKIQLTFEECKKSNLTIFNDNDKDFKEDWLNFHNKNCNLQILCKNCNLRKRKT